MSRFVTADLHLGHRNVIEYTGRPFNHIAEMNADLIGRWNSTVNDDEVWVLGDVAMGRIEETLPLCGMLTGTKILVVGNHDRPCGTSANRCYEWEKRYRDIGGFAEVLHGYCSITIGGVDVTVCHFPPTGESRSNIQDRYPDHRRPTQAGSCTGTSTPRGDNKPERSTSASTPGPATRSPRSSSSG